MPRKKENQIGTKDLKIGNTTLLKSFIPEYDEGNPNKVYLEQMIDAFGVGMKQRLIEASPMVPVIILLIIAYLAKLAADKDKQKH